MGSVQVKQIYKTFEKGKVQALQKIELDIASGELFGVIGSDGAGKTTLFRVLTTLLLPDSGTATVAGLDIVNDFWEIRKIVGYMPGKFSLYQDLSIEENLNFFATVFNTTVTKNYQLIEDIYVQLEPFKHRLARKLSGGMKQKLALCCALIHEPQVLFLDEPTTGVDPVSRKEFWDMLDLLKARGITIIVSTPYMDEASRCDRIALIQHGELLEVDTLEAILKRHDRTLFAVKGANKHRLIQDIRAYPQTESCFAFGEKSHVVLKGDEKDESAFRTYLLSKYADIQITQIRPNIEDVFIKLMLNQDAHV